jgi:excisionase family DNA binding protein
MCKAMNKYEAPLLTVPEVSRKLAVSEGTVRRWIATGQLRATKFGESRSSAVRVDPADLEQMIANARQHRGDAV